jgi:hypothetical protein
VNKFGSIKRIAIAVGASSLLVVGMAGAAFAASDGGATSATVNSVLSIAAPATIAFGAGVPGDELAVDNSTVTVISNNATGYDLSVQASDLTDATDGTIPASAMSFRDGTSAYAPLTAAGTDLLLASPGAETDANGTDHLIDAQLVLPWTQAGDYTGTFTFTASNI